MFCLQKNVFIQLWQHGRIETEVSLTGNSFYKLILNE